MRSTNMPIGVSTYQLRDALPKTLEGSLPSIEQLEAELDTLAVTIEDDE